MLNSSFSNMTKKLQPTHKCLLSHTVPVPQDLLQLDM